MNAQIDPYLDWLQIPADRRPPTHYDLLGLPPFQADASRAQAAAMRRISHVRKYQVGIHGELAIRLMSEISFAMTCLSDPNSKRQYDAELRGLATHVDEATSETLLQEPTPSKISDHDAATPRTSAPEEPPDDAFGLAPLPPDLGGSVASPALDRLSALVEMSQPPPATSSAPLTGGPAASLTESRYSLDKPEPPQPPSDNNTRFLIAVSATVAGALLLLIGGWMAFGSKKPVEKAHDDTALTAETSSTGAAPPPPVPSPLPVETPTLFARRRGEWMARLVDLYVPTPVANGEAHLLLMLSTASDGLVSAVVRNPHMLVGLNDYTTDRESGGEGDLLTVEGMAGDVIGKKTFEDATNPKYLLISRLHRSADPASSLEGSTVVRNVPLKISDELSFLHRFRPPAGKTVRFEAVYQGIDPWGNPGETVVRLAGRAGQDRTVSLRIPDVNAQQQLSQHYRAGDSVLVEASVAASPTDRLQLTSQRLEKPTSAATAMGRSVVCPRVADVLKEWNSRCVQPMPNGLATPGAAIEIPAAIQLLATWSIDNSTPLPAAVAGTPAVASVPSNAPDYAASERLWAKLAVDPAYKTGTVVTLVGKFQGMIELGPQRQVVVVLETRSISLDAAQSDTARTFLAQLQPQTPVEFEVQVRGNDAITGARLTLLQIGRWGQPATVVKVNSRAQFQTLLSLGGLNEPVTRIAFSPDGQRLATLSATSAMLWNARTGQVTAKLAGSVMPNNPLKWDSSGAHVAAMVRANSTGEITVWDARNLVPVLRATNGMASEDCLSFNAKGDRVALVNWAQGAGLAGVANGQIEIWEPNQKRARQTLTGIISPQCVAFSPEDKWLAIGAAEGLYLARKGTADKWQDPKLMPNGMVSGITAIGWLPGRPDWLYTVQNNSIAVWNASAIQPLQLHAGASLYNGMRAVAWRRDGSQLAAILGAQVAIWSTQGANRQAPAAGPPGLEGGMQVAYDPVQTQRLDPAGEGFVCLAYSPVNEHLAIGNSSGQVVLTEEPEGKTIQTFEAGVPILAVEWTQQGDRLASLHSDGVVRIWDTAAFSTPGPPVVIPSAPTPPPEAVANPNDAPAAPAADPSEAFKKALAEFDDAVDKISKDKDANETKWRQVVAQLPNVERLAEVQADQDAVKRMRRRLSSIAEARVDAAIRQRRTNISLYTKFLREAIAIDPTGKAGKDAQRMLGTSGLGF